MKFNDLKPGQLFKFADEYHLEGVWQKTNPESCDDGTMIDLMGRHAGVPQVWRCNSEVVPLSYPGDDAFEEDVLRLRDLEPGELFRVVDCGGGVCQKLPSGENYRLLLSNGTTETFFDCGDHEVVRLEVVDAGEEA